MMFYVVEIAEINGKVSLAIYPYSTEKDAVATFHQRIAGAMKNDSYNSELVMVIDSLGRALKT